MRKIINRKIKFFAVASIFMLSIFGCKNSFEVEEEQSQNVTGKPESHLQEFLLKKKEMREQLFQNMTKLPLQTLNLKERKVQCQEK